MMVSIKLTMFSIEEKNKKLVLRNLKYQY